MTTFSFGLSTRVLAVAATGLMALSGCPGDDGDDAGADTMSMTSMTTATGDGTDGMTSTTDPGDSTGGSGGGGDLSHDADIQPIWDAHCTMACHEPGGEWAFLDMAPGAAYGSIVSVMSTQAASLAFIEPGDVDASYLWHKINGTQANAGGGGLDMPKARGTDEPTVMTTEELDTVRAWIEAGAPM